MDFYTGDGISGFRFWLYCRVLWRWWPYRLAPKLPHGWDYNYRKDGNGFYTRHDS